jgi:TonB family protein
MATIDMKVIQLVAYMGLVIISGCATTPKTQCSEQEVYEWLKSNYKEIRRNVHYPQSARRKDMEGEVVILLSIKSNGSVEDITVLEPENFNVLAGAAVKGILRGKYSPPICGGTKTSLTVKTRIVFELPQSKQQTGTDHYFR